MIWDLASHDISIMLYCLKQKPCAVSAHGLPYFKKGLESIAYLTLFFDSHTIAHFHFSWLSPVKVRTILLGGDKKMILYDDTQPSEKVKIFDKGVGATQDGRNDLLVSYRSGDMVAPKIDNTEALKLVCQDFLQSILKGGAPLSDGAFSLGVVRILEAANRSLKQGGRRINIDL